MRCLKFASAVLLVSVANALCGDMLGQATKPSMLPRDLPLAYNCVAMTAMREEANYLGPKLGLPIRFPIQHSEISYALAAPPNLANRSKPGQPSFLGRIDAQGWSFSFSDEGRLCFVVNRKAFGERNRMGIAAWNDKLTGQKPVMDANDAYGMVSNWLAQFPVDVVALNRAHHPVVEQEFRWRNHVEGGPKDYLPLFCVRWEKSGKPVVDSEIDGRTKQMMDLRLEDDSVSQRPARILKNADALLKITDDEFSRYDDAQRQLLIKTYLTDGKW